MSFTMTVPAAVPSLFQSSMPWMPSSAAKYAVPPTSVSDQRYDGPGPMSFTITVPAAVPSLLQAHPMGPSSAWKYSVPSTSVRPSGR